jgi:asparagine synthase (glutamine-hydrolysing)
MCGITGIFQYDSKASLVDKDELLRMRETMFTRGPDGSGLWIDDKKQIGLAHRRLAIIDTTNAGIQPMVDSSGEIHITFNGEIYNHCELRKTLESKGFSFRSHSDTEVLLHLYHEYGTEMVHHLRGMYAFAIWDTRKNGLFLARDPFGIKPLYYADDGKTIRFGSQVKALLNGNGIDASPDPAGHVGFHLWGYIPEPYTLYKGIRAFPAGSTMWIDRSGRQERKSFFCIKDEYAKASYRAKAYSKKDLSEILREALIDSVKHHLIADVPIGVFLSSGLDSATLVALASESKRDLRTLTLGFEEYRGTALDETPLAKEIAAHYGTVHKTTWVTKEDFESERTRLFHSMDQPSIDGINTFFVSKVAAEAGMKVALSGVGADEIFGGYSSFTDIPKIVRNFGFCSSTPMLGKLFRAVSAPVLKHLTSPKYAGLLEYGGSYGGAYLLRRGLYMPWELPDILDGEMVKEGWSELNLLMRLEETVSGAKKAHLNVSTLEMEWYMKNQLLRDSDWAGMAHSLEIRTPFVDVTLFRDLLPLIISSMPPTKLNMASTPMKSILPDVLSKPKTGFAVPVRDWLMESNSAGKRGLRGWASGVYDEFS